MTHEEWIQGTQSGLFSPRSSELKAVDKALAAYQKATTPYGKDWESREVRIALEKWKKSHGPTWKTSERNKTGLVERLDRELPLLRESGNGYRGAIDSETAQNLRKGVLFFLSKCQTSRMPSNMSDFMNDGTDTSSDMHAFVDTGGAAGWRAEGSAFYDKDNKKNGFLESLSEKLIEYITELATMVKLDQYAGEAARWIVKNLPELLLQVFAGLLSKLTTAVDIGKGLVQALSAARGVWKTRLIEEGVMSGHPKIVVHTVREQIKNSGYKGIAGAAKAAMVAGVTAIPGAGTVLAVIANALASVIAFLYKVFDHFRGMLRLNRLFEDAKVHMEAQLHLRTAAFTLWFRGAIKYLPIIPSYLMTMPLTGSYYGFLTLVGTDGTEMSYKQLERNFGQFNDVKSWASDFVKDYSIKLHSADPIVMHSINVARGKKQQWENAKGGVLARMGKVAVGVIETAVSDVAKRG